MTTNKDTKDSAIKIETPESIAASLMEQAANDSVILQDLFLRRAIRKVVPDEILQLYLDAKTAIPGLDLQFDIPKVEEHEASFVLVIALHGHMIAQATFKTEYVHDEKGVFCGKIIHSISNITI